MRGIIEFLCGERLVHLWSESSAGEVQKTEVWVETESVCQQGEPLNLESIP